MQHAGHPNSLLTLREAGALLGLHPNTIRSQVGRGIIPGTKVGRCWRFLEADLVAWIRSGYSEAARVQLSALEREAIWHSTDVQASITSNSQPGRKPH
jgi:excisionase family DNA binding protein